MSAERPIRRRVWILDAERSPEAVSASTPSAKEAPIMFLSIHIGSGAERSIMACDQEMERLGVMHVQSSGRPSAAERQ